MILAATVMDMTVNTEYLQRRGRVRECAGKSAWRGVAQLADGTNKYSCSSSTPLTVVSIRFTFLQR